jgi:glycosyltransferase involved in cell wall biosynthesis
MHGWTKSLSSSVFSAARASGLPLVTTIHDFFLACPNGTFYDFQQQQVCNRTAMSAACIGAHCDRDSYTRKLWRVARHSAQKYLAGVTGKLHHFIHYSELSLNVMRPYLPADAHTYFLPNSIDAEPNKPAAVAENEVFAFFSRPVFEKGILMFLDACEAAAVTPMFIGSGEHEGGQQFEQEFKRRFPSSEITGWLPQAEAHQALRRARALVFPSRWYETEGMVVREAMAQGVPSIVSDGCAAREWITDGENGLLHRNEDTADLTKKLKQLRDDPAQAQRMGHTAHQTFWKQPPSVQWHARELTKIYAEIIHSHTTAAVPDTA